MAYTDFTLSFFLSLKIFAHLKYTLKQISFFFQGEREIVLVRDIALSEMITYVFKISHINLA